MCLTQKGQIYSWGLNIKGQLGLNDLPENMKADGQGELAYVKAAYQPIKLTSSRDKTPFPNFTDIACGFSSSYAIDATGQAWAWGGGNLGFKDVIYLSNRNSYSEDQLQSLKILKTKNLVWFLPMTTLWFCFVL